MQMCTNPYVTKGGDFIVKPECPAPWTSTWPDGMKELQGRTRPQSTPSSSHAQSSLYNRMYRPKTAAAILSRTDCDRVLKLEHEPTRRHNFENHLGTKRTKAPPWQKKFDTPLVPFVVGPGYILSRSKSKYVATLKNNFFDQTQEEIQKRKESDNEKNNLINQLQEQICNLTLYLEEERLNHKLTKQKAEDFLRDKMDQLTEQHNCQISDLVEERERSLIKQKAQLEEEFNQYRAKTEGQIQKLTKDIEFLQGAFESYKSTLHSETGEKWKKMEDEWKHKYKEQKQTALHELRTKLIQEKNAELSKVSKEQHQQMELLRKEHRKEIDALIRRFSNAAADLERLEKTTAELKETQTEFKELKSRYDETCDQLANTMRLLTDSKIKVLEFEELFEEKVQAIDDKYRERLDGLMVQNTELRRQFTRKCGELFDQQSSSEQENFKRIETAKEALTEVIKSKERANVNMSATVPELEKLQRERKSRPASAPTTRREANTAHLSAGETDHLHRPKKLIHPEPSYIAETSPETEQLRKELLSQNVRVFTKEDLLNALDT
ncbi:centrosomal protein of 164 kDa-like isoform X2 [Gigantopelta aegis]|uniref:centrosomal protein of 164 kDa-like isoform X2 n=1 Tax=Gigantopelta aegis TaxID=1735272 RepID=UPI001B88B6C8|nr:centrosomal protein of 164 kDa-like isoform X2 [Gigantopelta aegis]